MADASDAETKTDTVETAEAAIEASTDAAPEVEVAEEAVAEKPKRKRAPRTRKVADPVVEAEEAPAEGATEAVEEKPKRRAPRRKKADVVEEVAADAVAPAEAQPDDAVTAEPEAAPKKPRARKAPAKLPQKQRHRQSPLLKKRQPRPQASAAAGGHAHLVADLITIWPSWLENAASSA